MRHKRFAVVALFAALVSRADAGTGADPEGEFEVHREIVYAETGGEALKADVYVPQGEGPFPGVLVVHGGAWLAGHRTRMHRISELLARRRYVAMTIDYRLAPKHKFPAQIDDCRSAVSWMRTHGGGHKIDGTRIGGFGYSAGAHLVTLLAASQAVVTHADVERDAAASGPAKSDETSVDCRLQAVVAGGTPCDFRHMDPDDRSLAFWLGGTRKQQADLYRLASPREFVSPKLPPMFFYHGEKDALVSLAGAKEMKAALDEAGVPADFYIVPEAGHIATFRDPLATEKACDFLDLHLRVSRVEPRVSGRPK